MGSPAPSSTRRSSFGLMDGFISNEASRQGSSSAVSFKRSYSHLLNPLTLSFLSEHAYRYRRWRPYFPILHFLSAPRQSRLCEHVPSLGRGHVRCLRRCGLPHQVAHSVAEAARTEEPILHQERLPLLEESGSHRDGASLVYSGSLARYYLKQNLPRLAILSVVCAHGGRWKIRR